MSTEDTGEKPFSTQIERLNEKNYRPWSTQVRAVLRHQKVLDVTINESAKPSAPEATATAKDKDEYKTNLEAWETKAAKANAILLPTISGRLMTYVEDEDDPAKIWAILRDRFHPTTDSILQPMLPLLNH
jgi:hypothetical protein